MTGALRSVLRRLVPLLLVPLCVLANILAAAPWLRAFPVSVAGAPLYGAAVLSVLVPLAMARLRPGWFRLSIVIDLTALLIYALLVVLQDASFGALVDGIYRGPSQLLTFALPLVSPRSLMIAPAVVIWLAGALAGECIARRWYTVLPYAGLLIAFGLSYAGTQRAGGSDVTSSLSHETLLAGGLLITLLLMRVAQAWVRQDETAESTQPDGVLPLRGLLVGTAVAAVIAVAASLLVQADAFPKHSTAPQRVPSIVDSKPLTPLGFIASVRPQSTRDPASKVFTVRLDRPSSGYFEIANVDFYDGAGWSFQRTFRPSGGVLPDDTDSSLHTDGAVTQNYVISAGALTTAPWMPFLYRAQNVTGTSVNIDAGSGMIVPAGRLRAGTSYSVRSQIGTSTFADIDAATSTADTQTSTIDTQIPGDLQPTVLRLVQSFSAETGISSSSPLQFLKALQKDLLANYALSNNAAAGATASASSSSRARATSTAPRDGASSPAKTSSRARPSSRATPTPSPGSTSGSNSPDSAGSTGFADVLGSIFGSNRAGTPEQYATLVALVARALGVPARVATGFRVPPAAGQSALPAGSYDVTSADAWSWVEIPIIGAGWVALDATPGRTSSTQQPSESAAAASSSSSAPRSQNAQISQGDSGNAVAKPSRIKADAPASRAGLLVAVLIVVGVLVVALLLLLLSRKRVRAARRRRSPDPRTRLIGAWQESLDVLTEAGLPELTALTSTEIATLTGEQFGRDSEWDTAALGSAANAVAYSARTVVAPQEADEAWLRHRRLRSAVNSQLGARGRLAAGLRYHRPKPAARPASPASWAVDAASRRSGRPSARGYRGRRRAH